MIFFQTIRKGLTMQTTVSSEKKYAPPKRSEKQIGNTTFIVNSFFREKSDESIAVKLERLMKAASLSFHRSSLHLIGKILHFSYSNRFYLASQR